MRLALILRVTTGWKGRDQRKSPRIDVLMCVKGQVTALDAPVLVHDLSRTGFAVVSEIAFQAGETLDFRLVGEDGSAVSVTAEAIHVRPMPGMANLHLSGFMFVPGHLMGFVPWVSIDELIAAVSGPAVAYF